MSTEPEKVAPPVEAPVAEPEKGLRHRKQTEIIPPYQVPRPAKFNHSPALIYFVAALSMAGLFAVTTTPGSLYSLAKPG
ncbi:hypothetical protein K7X08_008555 [Anisodus acutangulus]|uniref:Uncharacterized protein n=1 Tax=Anisodus acutangulus TaxID=402998 RepID=A0A9Q1MQN5_9SOLA|nr:hypothetical protein K7X08_008555 [Anisodus acutangulus]